MIEIPFTSCVIVSTLDFFQITQRLESAIWIGSTTDRAEVDRSIADSSVRQTSKHDYFGQIQGFKFSATRLVGHRHFHLPAFLFPTIEGDIQSLHHGYEIEIGIRLHNITLALVLAMLGGLLATTGPALDSMLGGSKNDQYLIILQIFLLTCAVVPVHFYLEAWRAKKFFRSLFVKGFVLAPQAGSTSQSPEWSSDWLFQDVSNAKSSTQILRQNLPSFPRKAR